jgi:hypothetical protein
MRRFVLAFALLVLASCASSTAPRRFGNVEMEGAI